jgi:hypothetical protein
MDGAKRLLEQLHATSELLDTAELTTKELERQVAGKRTAKATATAIVSPKVDRKRDVDPMRDIKFIDLREGDTHCVAGRSALGLGLYEQAERLLRKAEALYLKYEDADKLLEVRISLWVGFMCTVLLCDSSRHHPSMFVAVLHMSS